MNANEQMKTPALLALDWGTSSLRAFLLGAQGEVLQVRSSAQGLQSLPQPGAAGFEQALAEIAADWLQAWPELPVVAGGMVGSAQGWKEAPYVRCPADVATLAAHSVRVRSQLGCDVVIAPGVLLDESAVAPDVIRGEEIQIAGALAANPELARRATMVLPGTHSKWVQVENGRIVRFASYMTGEMFAVLLKHSILGRLMADAEQPEPAAAESAFLQGVQAARESLPGDFLHQIFAARTLGLTRRLMPGQLKDYLSGLLIGHELVSGLAKSSTVLQAQGPLLLIGDAGLCQRYRQVFAALGVPVAGTLDNPAPRGLWEVGRTLGLINARVAEVQS